MKRNGQKSQNKHRLVKTVIDSRFADALKDERFQNKAKVDKYGRVLPKKSAIAEEMEEMYEIEEASSNKDNKKIAKRKQQRKGKDDKSIVEEEVDVKVESESDDDEEEDREFKLDLARGHAEMLSSSGDSSDSEVEEVVEGDENEEWVELDRDAPRVEWSSYRLAICNLDWDHLNSEDLFILCQSFIKGGGEVKSLTIYLSDFGKERMEEEEKAGPSFMVDEDDEERDDRWHGEMKKKKANIAVRQYEIDRLRYYYAVLVCDSPETATIIYEQCDGHEFENSGMRIDMRFIPDEMQFEDARVKERITRSQLKLDNYRPKGFINKATSMSNAEITWDENNPDRVRKMKNAFEEEDMERAGNGLIASSSDEEEDKGDEGKNRDERINILMQAAGLEQRDKDLEIEWEPPEAHENSDQSDLDEDEEMGRESEGESLPSDEESKTSKQPAKKVQKWKAYQDRRRELRKERKQAIRASKEMEKSQTEELPKKTKKAKKMPKITEDDTSRVVADSRFSALFTDSAFAIEKSSKDLKDGSLITKQVEARKAMMLEENRKAKRNVEESNAGEKRSEGQQLIEKLKRKTAEGVKKKLPTL
ncbi:unnamed protein product, partial [Mesorhabditis belari]|uniref:NUC153 domain-containing protein n=1 Tax=Mesorhabditis belari TaxID=2138241 RepID=A0AAF3EPY1_9BILA